MRKLKFILPILTIAAFLISGCSNALAISQNICFEDIKPSSYTKEEKTTVKNEITSDLVDIEKTSEQLYCTIIKEFSNLRAALADIKSTYYEYGLESKKISNELSALEENFGTTVELIEAIYAVQTRQRPPVELLIRQKIQLPS